MESLWIENRRNAISIETDSVFFNEALWSWRGSLWEKWTQFKNPPRPATLRRRGDFRAYRSRSLDSRTDN